MGIWQVGEDDLRDAGAGWLETGVREGVGEGWQGFEIRGLDGMRGWVVLKPTVVLNGVDNSDDSGDDGRGNVDNSGCVFQAFPTERPKKWAKEVDEGVKVREGVRKELKENQGKKLASY